MTIAKKVVSSNDTTFGFVRADLAQAIRSSDGMTELLVSGVNYFFWSTTIISPDQRQLLLTSSAGAKRRRGRGAKPARVWLFSSFVLREKQQTGAVGKWKTCFWFSTFPSAPRRRSCGNVGISPASGEISKGLVGSVGNLLLVFHAFHSPAISTALFPSVFCFCANRRFIRSRPGFPLGDSSWRAPPGNSGCSAR